MHSVLFIFIDGLGIGPLDARVNPLAAFDGRVLCFFKEGVRDSLPRQGRCIPTDAALGVPGLPQSATGQTALFTGLNAPAHLGCHLQGFPNAILRHLLSEHSLFIRLLRRGRRVTFANTYTPGFFEKRPRRVSATTWMCESAGVPLWQLSDLLEGRSLFMDYTNRLLRERGHAIRLRTPEEAADILLGLARDFDCCLYEYFLTDLIGHRGSFGEAVLLLQDLDRFLFRIVEALDPERMSLVICSDHGNIEDMSRKQHTLNPVPTLLWGRIKDNPAGFSEAWGLDAVTPLIEDFLACQTS